MVEGENQERQERRSTGTSLQTPERFFRHLICEVTKMLRREKRGTCSCLFGGSNPGTEMSQANSGEAEFKPLA